MDQKRDDADTGGKPCPLVPGRPKRHYRVAVRVPDERRLAEALAQAWAAGAYRRFAEGEADRPAQTQPPHAAPSQRVA